MRTQSLSGTPAGISPQAKPSCPAWPLSLASPILVITRQWEGQPHGLASRCSSRWVTARRVLSVCLSVQELQCDVSVEEDSRQEWTFTLYDFDNNGKVTREVSVPA